MKKRPWKKLARIDRLEYRSGDVKFQTSLVNPYNKQPSARGMFESLDAAEADLDAWWSDFWPRQIKSSRKA